MIFPRICFLLFCTLLLLGDVKIYFNIRASASLQEIQEALDEAGGARPAAEKNSFPAVWFLFVFVFEAASQSQKVM